MGSVSVWDFGERQGSDLSYVVHFVEAPPLFWIVSTKSVKIQPSTPVHKLQDGWSCWESWGHDRTRLKVWPLVAESGRLEEEEKMLKSRSSSDRRNSQGIECCRKRNTQLILHIVFILIVVLAILFILFLFIYTVYIHVCQLFVLLLFSAIFRFLKCEGRAAHLISSGLTFQACDENNLLSFESLKKISEIDEMLSSEDRRTGNIFFGGSGAASPGSCS